MGKYLATITILTLAGLYGVLSHSRVGKDRVFIGVVVALVSLMLVGCDSPPPGYKRNPGYDYAPAHARQFIPKYIPDDGNK